MYLGCILLMLGLLLAIAVYTPLLAIAAVGVVIATVHYFVTLDWEDENERKNGQISLAWVAAIIIAIIVVMARVC